MALKRQYQMSVAFSMASMTDIIFLLLIFFMVTSTYVFPTALELNLPQSSEQTALKPSTRVFVYPEGRILVQNGEESPAEVTLETLPAFLNDAMLKTPQGEPFNIAVFADEMVTYGYLVKILDIGAKGGMKMVLATKAAPSDSQAPANADASVVQQPASLTPQSTPNP